MDLSRPLRSVTLAWPVQMTVTFQETPLGRNEQWLTAEASERHRLKAYLDQKAELLTVYWSAAVRRRALAHIIKEAHVVLRETVRTPRIS
jgi:hypothetical protein